MDRRRVLIVDDEPQVANLIADVARGIGLGTTVVTDPEAFRAAYRGAAPALAGIVLDLVMPSVDGVELLRFLSKEGCGAPILLVTGVDPRVLATSERLARALGLKVAGALRKPFEVTDLESRLRKAFREAP